MPEPDPEPWIGPIKWEPWEPEFEPNPPVKPEPFPEPWIGIEPAPEPWR